MNPETHTISPEYMQSWTPYALLAVATVILPLLGAAVAWLSTRGMERWMKFIEFKRKLRLSDQETKSKQEQSKKLIDKILEGRNVAEGYKALLLLYDSRVRQLEDRDLERSKDMRELHLAHVQCIEDHAKCTERCEGLELQVRTVGERCQMLEDQCRVFQTRLHSVGVRTDPNPSPAPEKGDGKDVKRSG